jgi:predicted DNA-binding protein (MmcQ/YjbR family)
MSADVDLNQEAAAPDLRALLRTLALRFPEAYEEYPWGQVVVKVRKKVFVFLDGDLAAPDVRFSVKLPHSGPDVLSLPFAAPTGYGLGKSGWVSFHFEPGEQPPVELLEEWIAESYRAVAPKRLAARLDGAPPEHPAS